MSYIGSKRSSSLVSAAEITLDGAKLKSTGDSITKSDGTTAVLSESAGVVTLNNGTIGSGVVFPAGHVIQIQTSSTVVNSVSSTRPEDSITSTTGEQCVIKDITTERANSKILVLAQASVGNSTANNGIFVLFRDTTRLYNVREIPLSIQMYAFALSINYLDEPNVAAGTNLTYQIRMTGQAGQSNVMYFGRDSSQTSGSWTNVTFALMEIAA